MTKNFSFIYIILEMRILILLIFLLIIINMPTASAAARIEQIVANVVSETALPPMVKERMNESVAAIGTQLIAGHALPLTESWKAQQEATIHTVFDKILVGYTVKRVEIDLHDTTAVIQVDLLTWTDTIKNIKVETHVDGMPPNMEQLVRNDLKDVDGVFADGLSGLPIAATDWTNGILKRRLNKFMETSLPEFRADFDIKFDMSSEPTALVNLTVYPKLPVVRIVSLNMRSDTMPNIALVTHRTFMENQVNSLVGVPVAFIERHSEEIQKMLTKPLDAHKDFRALKIQSNVTFTAAEQMNVTVRSNSSRYRMRASGWVDVGRSNKVKDDLLFRLHIGRKISKLDEAFFQLDFKPQSVKWNSSLGYSRTLFDKFNASLRYDFNAKDVIADLEYEFVKNWLIRYEHKFDNDGKEAAIRYKLHDFLSIEWAVDRNESWLRFIGNF